MSKRQDKSQKNWVGATFSQVIHEKRQKWEQSGVLQHPPDLGKWNFTWQCLVKLKLIHTKKNREGLHALGLLNAANSLSRLSPPQAWGWHTTSGHFPELGQRSAPGPSNLRAHKAYKTHGEVFKHIHQLWSQEFHNRRQHKSHCGRNKESITPQPPRVQRAEWDLQPNHHTFAPPHI